MNIVKSRPKGGYKVHIRLKGQWTALCGYKPEAKRARIMIDRTGWHNVPDEHGPGAGRPCEACAKKQAELEMWADGRIIFLTAREYIVRLHRAKDSLQSKSGNLYFVATLDKDIAKDHVFGLRELPEAVAFLKRVARLYGWKKTIMAEGQIHPESPVTWDELFHGKKKPKEKK